MRAKFVNEIKQNKEISGLGSIGIGKASVLKGFTHINKTWPDFLKDAEPLKDVKYQYLAPLIEQISKWDFRCPDENIVVLHKEYTPMAMDLWIDRIIPENFRNLRVPGAPDIDAEVYYSDEWRVGRVKFFKKWIGGFGNTSQRSLICIFYLIEI